ncbi:YdhK family protein [Fictibacillus gelatini]|uniref:YdhK family protein n=1 Tax=Fictibacillus gelatini TaxID=225985 RepID=UPI00041BFBF6|nr:YdhK family protein [Fictibacillus gelatini]
MLKKQTILSLIAVFFLVLSACSNTSDEKAKNSGNTENEKRMDHSKMEGMDHNKMEHSSSGKIPQGLKAAKNPAFKVGSKAIVKADHMEGMDGAEATIAGAYDTIAYSVTYTPTTGGKPVKNHKWVIQEEIKDAGTKVLKPGTKVTLEADHMKGMKGATGTIETAEKTTVYMIDYTSTTGGEPVKNHKWVTESELTSK